LIVLCGNLTIPYCGRFFHCFYLEERKNCATALAGRINNIRACARGIVEGEVIFA